MRALRQGKPRHALAGEGKNYGSGGFAGLLYVRGSQVCNNAVVQQHSTTIIQVRLAISQRLTMMDVAKSATIKV